MSFSDWWFYRTKVAGIRYQTNRGWVRFKYVGYGNVEMIDGWGRQLGMMSVREAYRWRPPIA